MHSWLLGIQQQLSRQISENKLPHAILISGKKGAGYEEVALWLVQVLLCQNVNADNQAVLHSCGQCKTCQLYASNSYPDHIILSSDKTSIGVDEVRILSQFFEKTAHIGERKTALVKRAESMSISAANALLKTLEEPTANSFIILITDGADTLLPTIVSRCQKFEIRPPVGEQLSSTFSNTADGKAHNNKDLFANLSHYSELSDTNVADAFAEFRENIMRYLCYHQQRTEVLNVLVDGHGMRWLEKVIVDLMRHQWHWQTSNASNIEARLNDEQLWQIYRLVQATNTKLKTLIQVNRQFVSEKLLVDIANIANKAEE